MSTPDNFHPDKRKRLIGTNIATTVPKKFVDMQRTDNIRQVFLATLLAVLLPHAARCQEPLTLDSCRRLAAAQNFKLQAARENEEIDKNLVRAARTLYLPRIDFAGGWYYMGQKDVIPNPNDQFLPIVPYQAIDQSTGTLNPDFFKENPVAALQSLVIDMSKLEPMLDRNGNPMFKQYAYLPGNKLVLEPKHLWMMGFVVRQPIFTGLKIVAANKMAEATGSIEHSKAKLTEAEVIEKCDEDYWRVLSLQEKCKLATQYEELIAQFESDVQNLLDEGMATRNDLLKVQTKHNEARMKQLRASNGQTLARMALAQTLGIRMDQAVVSGAGLDSMALANAPLSYDSVDSDRPEVAMLRGKQQMLEAALMMTNSAYMPEVYLFGQYSWKYPNPYDGMTKTFGGDWSVGVTFRWSILTWGDRIYKTRIARLKLAQTEAELNDAESLVALQQMEKTNHLAEAHEHIDFATEAANQANENLENIKASYAEGASNLRDVLEAQTLWQEAQQELLDAKLEAANARIALSRAYGQLSAPTVPTK